MKDSSDAWHDVEGTKKNLSPYFSPITKSFCTSRVPIFTIERMNRCTLIKSLVVTWSLSASTFFVQKFPMPPLLIILSNARSYTCVNPVENSADIISLMQSSTLYAISVKKVNYASSNSNNILGAHLSISSGSTGSAVTVAVAFANTSPDTS